MMTLSTLLILTVCRTRVSVIESLWLRSEVRFLMGSPNFFLSPTLSTRLKTSFSVLYRAHNLLCLLFYLHTFKLFRYRNQISVERFKLVFMFLGFDKVVFFLQRLIGMWLRSVLVIVDFRVSSNYTPSSPKKEVKTKENTWGKISKRR